MKKLLILSSLSVFVLTSCAAVKLAQPTEGDLKRGQDKFEGYTMADLQQGYNLYHAQCGNCHSLYEPTAFTQEQWESIVPRMVNEAINMRGADISRDDEKKILQYVIASSRPRS